MAKHKDTEFGIWATLPNLHSSNSIVRCRHMEWTLLADDTRSLQSFHMGCQRQILGVRWQDHAKNVDIADTTGLPNITDIINKKRHALFGHVVRLDASVPAHQALKQVTSMKAGRCSAMDWRRPPGRRRKTWILYSRLVMEQQPAGRQAWKNAESSQRTTAAVYAP